MLIELINTENIDLDNPEIETCIQNVFCAYRERKHLVISDGDFLELVSSKISLGNKNCNTAKNILQNIRELNNLKNKVKYYCKIDMSLSSSNTIYNENDSYFTVGYGFFYDSSKTQLTKLLCEDINDYELYKIIANYYNEVNKNSGIIINFDVTNGGGANTNSNFEKIKSEGNLCFCILDSDRNHPKSKVGSTARKFSESSNAAYCKYLIITPHEVESLIPMKVIQEAILSNKLDNNYINKYDQLNALVEYSPSIKLYFDHKMGLKVNKVREIESKYNDSFWSDPLLNAPKFKKNKCLQEMMCDCKEECFAVEGFSTRLLDVGIEVLLKMGTYKINKVISSTLEHEWYSIGEHLFSWGCAMSKRQRTS